MHVVATAGHVDHGKSALIHALTGMEPDRWAEERRRGLTIDLGFAWTTLPGGAEVAFVDVPGHSRFVTNMLAGVGPVPAVLLVVAADQGWARQTSEHLAALDGLGVHHGVLAINRSDLADPANAIEQARAHLAGTSLEGIEVVVVSAATGVGLDRLRRALSRMINDLPSPAPAATRLWIDRVFTISGAGTVVTGTLGSGTIGHGDHLLISGNGRSVRVRGLQSLGTPVADARAVARVAVNLRGVKKSEVRRGDALIATGQWAQPEWIDVRLLNAAPPLPADPMLHIGSAVTAVRLRPLGADTARLRLRRPLPMHVGDRALLRDPGQERIVAGVLVLDTYPPLLRRRGSAARAAQLAALTGQPDPAGEVSRRRAVRQAQLVSAGHLRRGESAPEQMIAAGDWLIDPEQWALWSSSVHKAVDDWIARRPMNPRLPPDVATRQLALPDSRILEALVAGSSTLARDAGGIGRRDTAPTMPPAAEAALDGLIRRLTERPFSAPEALELVAAGLTDRHLAVAVDAGLLIRVGPGIYLIPNALDQAAALLRELPEPFTVSQARNALQTSRRVVIPLLEAMDRRGWTRRINSLSRIVTVRSQTPGA